VSIRRDQKRVRVLESYCLLATRNKLNVERAMKNFSEMLEQDQDYLPAVLGMATGFMIEKEQVNCGNFFISKNASEKSLRSPRVVM
jgi:Tfp pilus assembly protein PilF